MRHPIKIRTESEGRIVQWSILNKDYIASYNVLFKVLQNSATGLPKIKLTHSGYTRRSGEKSALLNLTVSLAKSTSPAVEIENLKKKGFNTDDLIISVPQEWLLDIHLPADMTEQNRLKKSAKLPKTITALDSTIPIQIRWDEIDGKNLFDWLTNEKSGLQILIQGKGNITVVLKEKIFLDKNSLNDWWVKSFNADDNIQWQFGIDPIIVDLISSGCFKQDGGKALSFSSISPYIGHIRTELLKVIDVATESFYTINKTKFLNVKWIHEITSPLHASINLTQIIKPGIILIAQPTLVQDLDGLGNGLDAINS